MTDDTPPATDAGESSQRSERRPGRPKLRGRQASHEPSREPEGRAERIPLGSHRQKLTTDQRPGFVRRWINDRGGRILQAQQGGWHFVAKNGAKAQTSDAGEGISQIVGTKEGGEPLRAYLMEIREDWYKEDQAAKQKRTDEIESQIRRGKDEHGEVGKDGRYMRVGTRRVGL